MLNTMFIFFNKIIYIFTNRRYDTFIITINNVYKFITQNKKVVIVDVTIL